MQVAESQIQDPIFQILSVNIDHLVNNIWDKSMFCEITHCDSFNDRQNMCCLKLVVLPTISVLEAALMDKPTVNIRLKKLIEPTLKCTYDTYCIGI